MGKRSAVLLSQAYVEFGLDVDSEEPLSISS